MISAEGETVQFLHPFAFSSTKVEEWLQRLEAAMKVTLKDMLQKALASHSTTSRDDWILSWPAQVMLAANQLIFAHKVTQSIQSGKLEMMKNYVLEKLEFLTSLAKADLSSVSRGTLKALLVLDVHNRDIAQLLCNSSVTSLNDFEWRGQLRYYMEEDTCVIKIINASFPYGYEYLGNTSRLVVTPLTQRCYRTLTR